MIIIGVVASNNRQRRGMKNENTSWMYRSGNNRIGIIRFRVKKINKRS